MFGLQAYLKKGGADINVMKALRYLLATPKEVKETAETGQSTGQWLSDILEYRQMPTALTPFDYITLSDSTELKVQEASPFSGLLWLKHCNRWLHARLPIASLRHARSSLLSLTMYANPVTKH